ncbi:MAG: hypothetical protein HKM93_18190 [Desulfobacteraceae bacterium]|nr:hypothetical protein [Desulfobacteraceae bacterium]
METTNVILCGLGGQGILFMTKIFAHAALGKGFNIIGAETHGMAQRGGSVISHLKIGDPESSLVRAGSADFLVALEENESYRNLPFVASHARIYVNSDSGKFPVAQVKSFLQAHEIAAYAAPASQMAGELGASLSTNLAMIGFYSAFNEKPFTSGELRETVERISPERFRELNLKVFDTAHDYGKSQGPV